MSVEPGGYTYCYSLLIRFELIPAIFTEIFDCKTFAVADMNANVTQDQSAMSDAILIHHRLYDFLLMFRNNYISVLHHALVSELRPMRQPVTLNSHSVNPLMATLKPQSNGPSYNNTVIGKLAVDGWAVTYWYSEDGPGRAVSPPCPLLTVPKM